MRIVTWNMGIAHGPYKERHVLAWEQLFALEPDIACVQECIPPEALPDGWSVHVEPFSFWASAIVTRLPMTPVRFENDSHLGRFGSYLATAHVTLPDRAEVLVSSVHESTMAASPRLLRGLVGPAMRRPSLPRPWWNDVVWHGLADLVRGGRFIIAGDWNTSRFLDQDGVPELAGQEFFDRAAADGWVDLHQQVLGHEERSWFGTRGPREHQPDVIFTDAITARTATRSWVEQAIARDRKLSDHAPVIAELEVGHG